MKDNKTIIIASIIVIALVVGGVLFRNKKGKENPLEITQKTLKETTTGKEEKISFIKDINKDDEISVEFLMHDYSDVPEDAKSLEETRKNLKSLTGKAFFKVKETGTADSLSSSKKAKEGYLFYYIVFDFKGDKNNPTGKFIHPQSLVETGWDPAPQFVAIVNKKDKYAKSYYRRDLLRLKGYESPLFDPKLNQEEWETTAAVWELNKDDKPVFALKYIDTNGEAKYLKLNF